MTLTLLGTTAVNLNQSGQAVVLRLPRHQQLGTCVDVLFRVQRDVTEARAFFRSAQAVTGTTPKCVPTALRS